jgi:hypothetical protein
MVELINPFGKLARRALIFVLIMKIRYAFWPLAVVFIAFAALQLNDPDPVLWVALYLVPAAVAAAVATGRRVPQSVAWALALGYLALAAWWWPTRFDGLTGPMNPGTTVEEGREALGLLIGALGLALCGYYARRTKVSPSFPARA